MNHNSLTIDFLARCVANRTFDEAEAEFLLLRLGNAIDRAIINGQDPTELQHAHDTLLDLIATKQ